MTTTDLEGCSTEVKEQQQKQQRVGAEFSPFSSLPGLTPTTAAPCPGDNTPNQPDPEGVHVTRTVFTIRADAEEDSPYLTKRLRQLEASDGLVTLSTEKIETDEEAAPTAPEYKKSNNILETEISKTSEKECESGESGPSLIEDNKGSEENKSPLARNQLLENLVRSANSLVSELTGVNEDIVEHPEKSDSLAGFTENEEDHSEQEIVRTWPFFQKTSSCAPTINDSGAAEAGFSEDVHTETKSTQTEGTPLTASVDFHLWERRRLARNGWGYYDYRPDFPPVPSCVSSVDIEKQANLERLKRSSCADSTPSPDQKSTEAASSSPVKSVSFDFQAPGSGVESPMKKETDLGDLNLQSPHKTTHTSQMCFKPSANGHCKCDDKFPSFCNPNPESGGDVITDNSLLRERVPPPTLSDTTPFDSTSTTPRACDNALNSSRSASIISDSGTSSSVPSELLCSSKPFKDRTQQSRCSSSMGDVRQEVQASAPSPPLSSSDGGDFPHLATGAPTLKVEYVTKVWDAYISDFLLASDHIRDAAIFDRATATCIACSFGFVISPEEFNQLQKSLSNLREATKLGVTVQGQHYKTVLADGRRGLMAKGAGRSGCSACQTRTVVLVAVHDHTGKPARCNEEVMRLGDFFWAKGL